MIPFFGSTDKNSDSNLNLTPYYLYILMTDLPLTMSLLQFHNPLAMFQTKVSFKNGYVIVLPYCTIPFSSVQFSSVTQSFLTLCDPMNHSTPGLPVHYQLLEITQTHIFWVGDPIQLSYPLSPPSPVFNLYLTWINKYMKKQLSLQNQGLADFCNLTVLYLGLTAYASISVFIFLFLKEIFCYIISRPSLISSHSL